MRLKINSMAYPLLQMLAFCLFWEINSLEQGSAGTSLQWLVIPFAGILLLFGANLWVANSNYQSTDQIIDHQLEGNSAIAFMTRSRKKTMKNISWLLDFTLISVILLLGGLLFPEFIPGLDFYLNVGIACLIAMLILWLLNLMCLVSESRKINEIEDRLQQIGGQIPQWQEEANPAIERKPLSYQPAEIIVCLGILASLVGTAWFMQGESAIRQSFADHLALVFGLLLAIGILGLISLRCRIWFDRSLDSLCRNAPGTHDEFRDSQWNQMDRWKGILDNLMLPLTPLIFAGMVLHNIDLLAAVIWLQMFLSILWILWLVFLGSRMVRLIRILP